jgi:hypothetical protein
MLSEKVFVDVCGLTPLTVYRKVKGDHLPNAIRFMREFQESLASYAKYRRIMDPVQMSAIRILALLERKIRKSYFESKRPYMTELEIKSAWGREYKRLAY